MKRTDGSALLKLWMQRSARERRFLAWGGALMLVLALWQWAWVPAWRTWQQAPAHQARLDATTQRMQQWQMQAQQLKGAAVGVDRKTALAWLTSHLDHLGEGAKLTESGAMLRLEVNAAPADGLATWLTQAREQAQVWPESVALEKESSLTGAVHWKGTLTLRTP